MRDCHASPVALLAAVAAFALVASAPGAAAQDGETPLRLVQTDPADSPSAPVRLIPPGGAKEPSAEPDRPPETGTPSAAAPKEEPPESDPVTATSLEVLDTASVGLIDSNEGGLGVALWRGSKRALIEKLLARLPAKSRSASARELAMRLLSTRAQAPQGESNGPDMLTSRVARLVELGAVEAASRLANQVPLDRAGEALSRSAVEALFLQNDNSGACQRVRDIARRSDDSYWQRAFAFCLLLSDEGARADIIVDVLAERGDEGAPLFSELVETLNGGEAAVVESLPDPTGLDLAMMRAANARPPADVLGSDRPAVLRSVAASPSAELDLRLAAGERALVYGAVDADRLNELYAEVQWDDAALADPAKAAEGAWGPRGRALLLLSAAAADGPEAKARTLSHGFELARENGGYDVVAAASAPVLAALPQDPALAWFAPDAVSALLTAGHVEQARAWLGLAESKAEPGTVAGEASSRLWALGLLAAPDTAAAVDETALAAWRQSAYGDDAETAREAEVVALSLLEALGAEPSPGRWADLLAEGTPPRVAAPDIAWGRALQEASAAGRVGETILIALLGLNGANGATPGAAAMRLVIESLTRVGLDSEARSLALETAVAYRL